MMVELEVCLGGMAQQLLFYTNFILVFGRFIFLATTVFSDFFYLTAKGSEFGGTFRGKGSEHNRHLLCILGGR